MDWKIRFLFIGIKCHENINSESNESNLRYWGTLLVSEQSGDCMSFALIFKTLQNNKNENIIFFKPISLL